MQSIKSKSVIRLESEKPTNREWCGRDDNSGHYHNTIPHDQKVITLTLKWKDSTDGKVTQVGRYRINLPGLEAEGYVEKRAAGYYLRFQHTDNRIEIAINRKSKPLEVGRWP